MKNSSFGKNISEQSSWPYWCNKVQGRQHQSNKSQHEQSNRRLIDCNRIRASQELWRFSSTEHRLLLEIPKDEVVWVSSKLSQTTFYWLQETEIKRHFQQSHERQIEVSLHGSLVFCKTLHASSATVSGKKLIGNCGSGWANGAYCITSSVFRFFCVHLSTGVNCFWCCKVCDESNSRQCPLAEIDESVQGVRKFESLPKSKRVQ